MTSARYSSAMHRLTLSQKAPAGRRFTPGCFDAWIGEAIPVTVSDDQFRGAEFNLLDYEIIDNGSTALLRVESEPAVA